MRQEKLERLLNELAQTTAEPVSAGLAEDIKRHIPDRLVHHRAGMDTISIIIDLRIGKLAAAAVIIITLVLCANFLGGRDTTGTGILQDGKLMVKYFLGGVGAVRSDLFTYRSQKDIVYYGSSDPQDSNAVLMHRKLSDGGYQVIFGDMRTKIVTADELVELQARMLQKKVK